MLLLIPRRNTQSQLSEKPRQWLIELGVTRRIINAQISTFAAMTAKQRPRS
jgi:hypothetical protein